jgi:hypothetical protein
MPYKTYNIVRNYWGGTKCWTIETGLTLEQAQEHCQNPETSSSTCTLALGKRRTRLHGPWFDSYTEEKG